MICTLKGDVLEVSFKDTKNFSRNIMFSSDWHFDNAHCDRNLLASHLEEAERLQAPVVCAGDLFCLMQGKFDPRKSNSALRPEHMKTYLDDVLEDAVKFLSKYDLTYIFFEGNHESNVRDRVGTNMLKRLATALPKAYCFGYQGLVKFAMNRSKMRQSLLYATHHGKWGGIVSKGAQSVARYSSIFPQADIIHTGHTHDGWVIPDRRYWLNKKNNLEQKNQWHIKTPTYKDEFHGNSGWAVERIVKPKPMGCIFCKVTMRKGHALEINFDLKIV